MLAVLAAPLSERRTEIWRRQALGRLVVLEILPPPHIAASPPPAPQRFNEPAPVPHAISTSVTEVDLVPTEPESEPVSESGDVISPPRSRQEPQAEPDEHANNEDDGNAEAADGAVPDMVGEKQPQPQPQQSVAETSVQSQPTPNASATATLLITPSPTSQLQPQAEPSVSPATEYSGVFINATNDTNTTEPRYELVGTTAVRVANTTVPAKNRTNTSTNVSTAAVVKSETEPTEEQVDQLQELQPKPEPELQPQPDLEPEPQPEQELKNELGGKEPMPAPSPTAKPLPQPAPASQLLSFHETSAENNVENGAQSEPEPEPPEFTCEASITDDFRPEKWSSSIGGRLRTTTCGTFGTLLGGYKVLASGDWVEKRCATL